MSAVVKTIAQRLRDVVDELVDIAECADDIGWRGVQHKAEEAVSPAESALSAALQYEREEGS